MKFQNALDLKDKLIDVMVKDDASDLSDCLMAIELAKSEIMKTAQAKEQELTPIIVEQTR